MIAHLVGTLSAKVPGMVVVDVHGVGYAVQVPLSTYNRLPPAGTEVKLLTLMSVRENAVELFGFLTQAERELFGQLIRVSGVGPKLALGVLSAMEPGEFRLAVLAGDVKALARIPGVGRKTAERLVVELRGVLEEISLAEEAIAEARGGPHIEAVRALVSLGLKHPEAAKAVRAAAKELGEEATTEQLVREALRRL